MPLEFTASVNSTFKVELTWDPTLLFDISHHSIYQDGKWVADVKGNNYTVNGLAEGGTYTFTIRASDTRGVGSNQTSIRATTLTISRGPARIPRRRRRVR